MKKFKSYIALLLTAGIFVTGVSCKKQDNSGGTNNSPDVPSEQVSRDSSNTDNTEPSSSSSNKEQTETSSKDETDAQVSEPEEIQMGGNQIKLSEITKPESRAKQEKELIASLLGGAENLNFAYDQYFVLENPSSWKLFFYNNKAEFKFYEINKDSQTIEDQETGTGKVSELINDPQQREAYQEKVFSPILNLETATAGSSLKLASMAADYVNNIPIYKLEPLEHYILLNLYRDNLLVNDLEKYKIFDKNIRAILVDAEKILKGDQDRQEALKNAGNAISEDVLAIEAETLFEYLWTEANPEMPFN